MTKNKKSVIALIERSMTKDKGMLSNLKDIVIFQDDNGTYNLFDQYTITKTTTNDYVVSCQTTYTINTFFTLKNAVTWCIFDKQNKIYESARIVLLDNQLGGLEVDLAIHKKLFEKAKKTEDQLIYLSKLGEDRIKKTSITDELYAYNESSKNWQIKRFNKKPA